MAYTLVVSLFHQLFDYLNLDLPVIEPVVVSDVAAVYM